MNRRLTAELGRRYPLPDSACLIDPARTTAALTHESTHAESEAAVSIG